MITPLGLGDDNAAGGAQPAHHWCIGIGGRRLREYLRARARRLPGYVEQVLDADNDAIKPAQRNARPRARVANGHAAAPPTTVMNSRRLIRSPRRRGQAATAAHRSRAL